MIENLTPSHLSGFQRPKRLSPKTRALAQRGLSGEFGRTMVDADPTLQDKISAVNVSAEMGYALAVRLIAENAPLRILDEELIIGTAIYREAAMHKTPIHGGYSTSHLTPGFDELLRIGYQGLRTKITAQLANSEVDSKGEDLLNSMLVCLEAATIWHNRHIIELESRISGSMGASREHYIQILENLRNVPEHPPQNFVEAVQALWFGFAFQRLIGNWPGIGRIDKMLGPFLEQDLTVNRITIEQAREVLAYFWIKGTEWIGSREWDTGDAQHYQNIVLSGIDVDGNDVTNAVTYLVLDIVEELHISDFPVAVRVSSRTPDNLWQRIAQVQRTGGGIVSIYNEDLIISALTGIGIPLGDAREFANDGCWEVLIPGQSSFLYRPFDLLYILQETLGLNKIEDPIVNDVSFDSLYQRFTAELGKSLDHIQDDLDSFRVDGPPATGISMLVKGCIERGRGYNDRGPVYNFMSPHAGGMADVANSLLVIKKLVYEEQVLTLRDFVEILRANWDDHEELRQRVRHLYPTYGNDDEQADTMLVKVFNTYTDLAQRDISRAGLLRPPGISTFGREIEWRVHRKATAHGFREGDFLANNFSPTPNTDLNGPTAVIASQCKVDFTRLPNGATLELKLHPTAVMDEDGLAALETLLKVFCQLGGWYLNVDVVDSATLIDAQKNPERYPNLTVRVSGWSARFNTLSTEWQDMVIQRTQQIMG